MSFKFFTKFGFFAALFLVTSALAAQDEPPFILMQGHTFMGDTDRHQRSIDLMKEAGVQMIRDEIMWHTVETQKGKYKIPESSLENIDYTIEQGIEPFIILNYTNEFYDDGFAPRSDEGRTGYAGYCGFMARELKGKVKYFEIWNEPNVDGFWKPKANAEDYAKALKAAYTAIKESNPEAVVVAGATSLIDVDFTKAIFEAGAIDYMDAYSVHPYITPRKPEGEMYEKIKEVYDMIASYGEAKPLWITETGYPTHIEGVSEEYQAEMIARVYLLGSTFGWMPVAGWYWFGPDGPNNDFNEDRFGLIRPDWENKPSFFGLQTASSFLDSVGQATLEVKEDVYIVRIASNDQEGERVALWSLADGSRVEVSTKAETVSLETMLGSETKMQVLEGKVYLELDGAPVYLYSEAEMFVEALPKDLPFPQLLPTQSAESTLTRYAPVQLNRPEKVIMANSTEKQVVKSENLDISSHLKVEKADSKSDEFDYIVTFPEEVDEQKGRVSTLFTVEGHDYPSFLVLTHFAIRPAVLVSYRTLPKVNGSVKGKLTLEIPGDSHQIIPQISASFSSDTGLLGFTRDRKLIKFEEGRSIAAIDVPMKKRETDRQLIPVDISLQDQFGSIGTYSFDVTFFEAPKRQKEILIDGSLKDWPAMSPIVLNRRDQIISEWREWGGIEDVSAEVYVSWDDDFLYIAAEVLDNEISAPVEGFHLYKNDGLEVYVDADLSDEHIETYNGDDHQFGFFNEGDKAVVFRWSDLGDYEPRGEVSIKRDPDESDTLSGSKVTYIIEGRVPNALLNLKPEPGMQIGFNTGIADDDDPQTIHPFGQEVHLMWNGRRNCWQNPGYFGRITLTGHPEK